MVRIHLESIEKYCFKLKWQKKVHEDSLVRGTKIINKKNQKIGMKGMLFQIKKIKGFERILNKKKSHYQFEEEPPQLS